MRKKGGSGDNDKPFITVQEKIAMQELLPDSLEHHGFEGLRYSSRSFLGVI